MKGHVGEGAINYEIAPNGDNKSAAKRNLNAGAARERD